MLSLCTTIFFMFFASEYTKNSQATTAIFLFVLFPSFVNVDTNTNIHVHIKINKTIYIILNIITDFQCQFPEKYCSSANIDDAAKDCSYVKLTVWTPMKVKSSKQSAILTSINKDDKENIDYQSSFAELSESETSAEK